MGTPCILKFDFSPYLRGDIEDVISTRVKKHYDGYPTSVIPILKKAWEMAEKRVVACNDYDRLPFSTAQAIMGLLLADAANAFRLWHSLEEAQVAYIYHFQQHVGTKHEPVLTIRARGAIAESAIFEGGYKDLLKFWKLNSRKLE